MKKYFPQTRTCNTELLVFSVDLFLDVEYYLINTRYHLIVLILMC